MPPERPTPEELPRNDADTAGVRVPLESFPDQDGPEPSGTRQKPTVQSDKHFFGIKQDAPSSGFVFNDDYDKRFPDDPYCQETSAPNAKVWRVYVEEAATYDANMVGRYRDGLDVMLVFAGLFSAVVTSFLVQASQNLQADYGEMTAILLHDLVFIQLAIADGASVINITSPSANPAAPLVANRIDILVNGLWVRVVSLSASLAVALAAVLVKQWLHHYMALHSGTSRHRSHVRHFRFTGLECWHVRIIIGILPIIMYLSLILFLSAWAVGVITVILCALYFISNTLPIVYPQCPYQTPLSDFLNSAYQVTLLLWYAVRRAVETQLRFSRYLGYLPWDTRRTGGHSFQSLINLEDHSVAMAYSEVSVDALDWLYTVSSNPVVERIVIMALGGLPASVQDYATSIWHDALSMQNRRGDILMESIQAIKDDDRALKCRPGSECTLERVLRTYLFLPLWPSESWEKSIEILSTGNACVDLALAITPIVQRKPSPLEMRGLIISGCETVLHPLIWNKLITRAASNGAFRLSDPKVTAGAHAQFATLMLPNFSVFPRSHTVSPGTLQRALEVCPPPALCDYLLQMPALMAFDSDVDPSISSLAKPLRVLLAAAKFALHHIDERHTPSEVDIDNYSLASEVQSHWMLLFLVLSSLTSAWFFMHDPTLVLRDELMQLVEQVVVTKAFNNPADHTPSVPLSLLDECVSSILSICHTYTVFQRSCPPQLIHPALLNIAMSRLLYNFHSLHIEHRRDHTRFSSLLQFAGPLMAAALRSCRREAYCLFVKDKWIQRLGPLWIAGWHGGSYKPPGEQIIDAYISGLTSSMAVSRQQFLDHLYEPENLAIAMCVVFNSAETFRSLIALNPMHSSWETCRAFMESITTWNHNPDRGTTEFPGNYLLNSKIIQCSDCSVFLKEHMRKRFTVKKAGEKLDMAMRVLKENLTEVRIA